MALQHTMEETTHTPPPVLPRRPAVIAGGVAGILLLGIAVVAVIAWSVMRPVPITVDGRRLTVPRSTTVSELLATRALALRKGNLVAVKSHRVLRTSGGAMGAIWVGSEVATAGTLLPEGSVVVSIVGSDVVESTRSSHEPIAPRLSYAGHGPYVSMSVPSHYGERIVTRGTVSGEVVKRRVTATPQDGMIQRYGYSGHAKVIALSFDDGPHPTWTPRVLAVLAKFKVKATFFEIGEQVHRYPNIAREVSKAGMTIGNHTQTHQDLSKLSASDVGWQIDAGQTAIQQAIGVSPVWLRPPGGALSPMVYEQADKAGVRLMLWDVDTNDWKRPSAATIVSRVVNGVRPGEVVLMHDGGGDRSRTLAALPTIIKKLLAKGYRFETVDQLLGK